MRLACLGACIVISPEAIKVPSGPWNHRSPRGDGDVKTVAALNVMEIAPFRMMDRWCSDMLDLVPRARLHRKNLGVINKPTAIVRSRPAPGFEQPSCRVLGQALGPRRSIAGLRWRAGLALASDQFVFHAADPDCLPSMVAERKPDTNHNVYDMRYEPCYKIFCLDGEKEEGGVTRALSLSHTCGHTAREQY